MRRGGRRHRILQVLSTGPARLAALKQLARDPDRERTADRAATWAEVCRMADEDLVTIAGGAVSATTMGLAQLVTAERVWALEAI